jgi:hypothetical protein
MDKATSDNGESTGALDVLFLRIFKVVLLAAMTLSLLAAIVFAAYAGYGFFHAQAPKEPTPAAEPPKQEVDFDKLLKELTPPPDDSKQSDRKGAGNEKDGGRAAGPVALRYLEDATKLFRCASEFAKTIDAPVEQEEPMGAQARIERLRAQMEKLAVETATRGDRYVADSVRFTCSALANQKLIEWYKQKKPANVFYGTLSFHLREWDRIQQERADFAAREAARVAKERAEEEARVITERAQAFVSLMIAGIAFAIFMAMALYLIFAKIESNLRDLKSLRNIGA